MEGSPSSECAPTVGCNGDRGSARDGIGVDGKR